MTASPCVGCPFRRDCDDCPWSGENPTTATVSDARTGAASCSIALDIQAAPDSALTLLRPRPTASLQATRSDVTSIMPQTTRRPNKPISQEFADSLADRILQTVVRVRRGRWVCWESTQRVNPVTGYATIGGTVDGVSGGYQRHRIMYVHYFGEFPTELTIDHLCENPTCCNPRHLRPATHAENVLRSKRNPFALHAQKTECVNGHPLSERTLDRSFSRKCGTCHSAKRKAYRLKRAGTLPAGDERHGTLSGYHYWACRCEACREWQRATYRARKARVADAP